MARTTRQTAACGLALALLALAGCAEPPGKPDPAQRIRRPDELQDIVYVEHKKVPLFDYLFDQNCAACHGENGKGGPAPPLNDPLFLALVDESFLEKTIAQGREGTLMPAFGRSHGGNLVDTDPKEKSDPRNQVKILAKGIKERWGKTVPAAAAKAPPYAAVAKRGDAESGAETFLMACATCHGKNGEGTPQAGAINDPMFLSLLSEQALRRIIITGRPDLKSPMPNYADPTNRAKGFAPLTEQDVADLTALLMTWRNKAVQASR